MSVPIPKLIRPMTSCCSRHPVEDIASSVVSDRFRRVLGRVAQWIRRRSTEPKIPGSIPGVVINIFLFDLYFHLNLLISGFSWWEMLRTGFYMLFSSLYTKELSARSIALPNAAALFTVSSNSLSGTLSMTTPAPACK